MPNTYTINKIQLPNGDICNINGGGGGGGGSAISLLNLTALAASWSNESPSTQTISATGVTNNIIVSVSSSATTLQYDTACEARILCTEQGTDTITLTCYGTKPTIDLPVTVFVLSSASSFNVTAEASEWSNDTPPTQTIATSSSTNSNIIVGISSSATSQQYNEACEAKIMCTSQGLNTITLTAYGETPTIDIPITVFVLG